MLADIAAACMLVIAGYAQWSVPACVAGNRRIWAARLLLAGIGVVLGILAIRYATVHDISNSALFLVAFGQVHVPAAILVLRKGQRVERIP
jgi:hypothetical protein